MASKTCHNCGTTKPLSKFQRCASKPMGVQSQCRECRLTKAAAYREANRETLRARGRDYAAAHREDRAEYHQRYRNERLAAMAEWRRENPERIRELSKRWYENNRERHAAAARAWAEANADRLKAHRAEYYENNKALFSRLGAQRRMRKRDGFIEHVEPLVVLERDDGICGICGGDVDPTDFHVDHRVPLALGGEHSYENCQTAHPTCNRRKGARLLEAVA